MGKYDLWNNETGPKVLTTVWWILTIPYHFAQPLTFLVNFAFAPPNAH